MTLGSLFSGIGGFELAATWNGIEPLWSNEIDKYACKVLRKNFNHEIIEKDIREIGRQNLEPVDIISGGFPCQPFSTAGKRKGKDDERYLWDEMLRVIGELKPKYVIGENVAGLLSMENGSTLGRILSDLENEGYRNEVFIIPAASVGAWHRRDRIWICAHSIDSTNRADSGPIEEKEGIQKECGETGLTRMPSGASNEIQSPTANTLHSGNGQLGEGSGQCKNESEFKEPKSWSQHTEQPDKSHKSGGAKSENVPDSNNERCKQCRPKARPRQEYPQGSSTQPKSLSTRSEQNWTTEPDVGRVANGIPNRVDRLKGLGNAIVPQVAYELFKAIKEADGC